jgi:hypothetical protein
MGEKVVRRYATETATQTATPLNGPVVIGLDGGYVRSRHHQEERHFEVIAGKVIDAAGTPHRFAFARNGPGGLGGRIRAGVAAARSPASTVAATSANFSATSSATRTCWCTMLPGVDMASRSRPRSLGERSMRSWSSA